MKSFLAMGPLALALVLFTAAGDDVRNEKRGEYFNAWTLVSTQGSDQYYQKTNTNLSGTDSKYPVYFQSVDWGAGASELTMRIYTDAYPANGSFENLIIPAGATFDIEGVRVNAVRVTAGPGPSNKLYVVGER